MTELEKSCLKMYFARVKMYLRVELTKKDYDINEDFPCKWKDLEEALCNAIGKEQSITRLSNFLDKNYTDFNSQPLEILFNQVDCEVDSALGRSTAVIKDSKGRSQTDLTFAVKSKY